MTNRFAGDWIQTKINVIKNYKFTISFENSVGSGYTTEKLVHAMQAETIPIYWGNPHVDWEFNTDSFIWVRDKSDIENAVEKVIKLNEDDSLWTSMMGQPWVLKNYIKEELTQDHLETFILNIFGQEPSQAVRRYTSQWKQRRNQLLFEGKKVLKR